MTLKPLAYAAILPLTIALTACNDKYGSNSNPITTPTTPPTTPVDPNPGNPDPDPDPDPKPTDPQLPVQLGDEQALVFYRNDDGYEGWGLHLWNDETCSALTADAVKDVTWPNPMLPTGIDETDGAYFVLDLKQRSGCINYIVHRGDEKAFGDQNGKLELTEGNIIYTVQGNPEFTYAGPKANFVVNLSGYGAHWIDANTLVWEEAAGAAKVSLRYSPSADISVTDNTINGGMSIDTQATAISDTAAEKFPHLSNWSAFTLQFSDDAQAKMALKSMMVATAYDAEDKLLAATYVQSPGAIDAYHAEAGLAASLGAQAGSDETLFALWAPTATDVKLALFNADLTPSSDPIAMQNEQGVWHARIPEDLRGSYYRYQVTVYHHVTQQVETLWTTDPYSQSLSTNGRYSHIVDLNDDSLKPEGWDAYAAPTISHPEAATIYEMHIRDFSIADESMSEAYRGKYTAFTQTESTSVKHLSELKTAGLTHVHLLPTFDIATVNENPVETVNLNDTLATLCAARPDASWCTATSETPIPVELQDDQAVIFYAREDGNYEGWGLHLWTDETCNALTDETLVGVEWPTPFMPTGVDDELGAYYVLGIEAQTCINFIVHKGDEKALGDANLKMDLNQGVALATQHGESQLAYLGGETQATYDQSMTLESLMASFEPSSEEAQNLTETFRGLDSFNWGYDPYHYNAPDGSYASDAQGSTRIKEFRMMVKALHELGLRVVMDVVYNHTNSSGLWDNSVLDKVVPGYYHRRNPKTGAVENSSCCDNTASEHDMMEKLMIDSLALWTEQYKIDGFRFDLMGHHMVSNMTKALEAVQAIDPDNYFYGEAWNFGEVANGARGRNAIQKHIGGTGIGTFNDRARDAVRGGGPFDSGDALRARQGYGTGLYFYPNELADEAETAKEDLLERSDWIRLSLAGNLANYPLPSHTGDIVLGKDLAYFDQAAGYTYDPQENVNYISKHDNQTLWDNLQYKAPTTLSPADRTRMQNFSLSVPMLSQGIVFLHMGVDVLRSKSLQRDSFDAGDWYNSVDFTGLSHNWNIGLPSKDKDGQNYGIIAKVIQDPNTKPNFENIDLAKKLFKEWLSIRKSSPLFSLQSEQAVLDGVTFLNTGPDSMPGLIVMQITDTQAIDENYEEIILVFNPSNTEQQIAYSAEAFSLHPVQMNSADMTIRTASAATEGFTVPALTTAVFVK